MINDIITTITESCIKTLMIIAIGTVIVTTMLLIRTAGEPERDQAPAGPSKYELLQQAFPSTGN
jgi:hypothetical protein